MAGNYPDPVSNRMALDRDGTQMFRITTDNRVIQLTNDEVIRVQNEGVGAVVIESGTLAGSGNQRLFIYFPELRDVYGHFSAFSTLTNDLSHSGRYVAPTFSVSPNSTNGLDGTWSQVGEAAPTTANVRPNYRTLAVPVSESGVRAVMFSAAPTWTMYCHAVHLYGRISAGQNPHRLGVWHPTNDAQISGAYLDWGNTPRSSSEDRVIRIKNLSTERTAHSVELSFNALTEATSPAPSVAGQHSLSTDGLTFTGTVNIGDLAPGEISGMITVRRVTPADAELSVWAPRVVAQAGSWSG